VHYLLLLLSFLLIVPVSAFANGSPIDGSDIRATGNIHMLQKKDISLDEENLHVVLDNDFSVVRVEYHLTNHGGKAKVTYGFPVDYVPPEELEFTSEEKKPVKSLQNVVISADGKSLRTREYHEPKKGKQEKPHGYVRTWMVADLEFAEASSKVVTVSYRVKNFLDDWVYTKSFKPRFSDRTFSYILSPSGNWGNGVVRRVSISVDLSKVRALGGTVKKIAPTGYAVTDNTIRWELENFDLRKAKDLKIVYDDSARLMSNFVIEERLPARLIKQVKGTSALKDPDTPGKHDPRNVVDNDLDTAWCEGVKDDGIGQSITFELKDAIISGIGIINGYTKNGMVYQSNNRIKKIKVIAVQKNGVKREEIVDLPKREFDKLNRKAVAPFIDWVADYGDPYETTRSITLVIQDIYPGSKYHDTCISEVYLLGFSSKEKGVPQ